MKVVFRLTQAQSDRAAALESAAITVAEESAEIGGYESAHGVYCFSHHAATNPDQWVGRGFDPLTLVVEGQREALFHDGGFAAAKAILGDKPRILSYETSDPRLRWDETLRRFMHTRASKEERVEYALAQRAARSYRSPWWHLLPELRPVVAALRRGERIAAAQYAPPEIRLARIFAGL